MNVRNKLLLLLVFCMILSTFSFADIDFIIPTESNNTIINVNYTYIVANSSIVGNNAILYFNNTNYAMNTTNNITWTYNVTNLSDGIYVYQACVNFTASNFTNCTENRTINIDTMPPFISWTSPFDNQKTFTNISIIANLSDDNLYRVNVSMRNSTGDAIWSLFYDNITTTWLEVNVSSNLTQGYQDYNVEICVSDDHTNGVKPNKVKVAPGWVRFIKSGNDYLSDIKMSFLGNGGQNIPLPVTSDVTFQSKGDHWDINFTTQVQTSGIEFELTSDKPIEYLSSRSGIEGHFVWGDFYHDFSVMKNYYVNGVPQVGTLNVVKITDKSYLVILTFQSTISPGSDVDIDPLTGGLNIECQNRTIKLLNPYAAQLHADILIPEIILDGNNYVTVFEGVLNSSQKTYLLGRGSGVARKQTFNSLSDLWIRATVDGIEQYDVKLRTIENPDDRGVFTIPLDFEIVNVGESIILIEMKEDGLGAINVSEFQIHILSNKTSDNSFIFVQIDSESFSYSNFSYEKVANFTIFKKVASKTLIDSEFVVSKQNPGPQEVYCYMTNGVENTKNFVRVVEGPTDTGSTAIGYLSVAETSGFETWDVYCKSILDDDPILINMTILLQSMINNNNQTISAFYNETGGVSSSYSGLDNVVLSYDDYLVRANSEIELTTKLYVSSISGGQEGTDSPTFELKERTGKCSNSFPRSLDNNDDVGTIVLYLSCNNVTQGDILDFDVVIDVQGSETLVVLNASIVGSEMGDLDTSSGNIPPIVAIINPVDASLQLLDNQDINISTIDPNGNLNHCKAELFEASIITTYLDNFESGIGDWDLGAGALPASYLISSEFYSSSTSLNVSGTLDQFKEWSNKGLTTDFTISYRIKVDNIVTENATFFSIGSTVIHYINDVPGIAMKGLFTGAYGGTFNAGWNKVTIFANGGFPNRRMYYYLNNNSIFNETLGGGSIGDSISIELGNVGDEIYIDDITICPNYEPTCGDEGLSNFTIDAHFNDTTKINYTDYAYGNYSLTVTCFDNLGLFGTKEISLVLGNVAPVVNITSPVNNETVWGQNEIINVTHADSNLNMNYCNLSILNDDGSFNSTVDDNFLNYAVINYTDYSYGNYSLSSTCYDEDGLFNTDMNDVTLFCSNDWQPLYTTCTVNFETVLSYFDNNSCFNYDGFPADNSSTTDCVCQTNNIGLITSWVPYCDLGDTCYIYADTQLTNIQEQDLIVRVKLDNTSYQMAYTGGVFYLPITSANVSDVRINVTAWSNASLINCSFDYIGYMKFRDAFNINVSIYKVGMLNDSYSPQPYKNEFDYIYVLMQDAEVDGFANAAENMRKIGEGVENFNRGLNKFIPGSDKLQMVLGNGGVSSYADNRVYFWGEYNNGKATIKLYEKTNYSIHILNTKFKDDTYTFYEFSKPEFPDKTSLDTKLVQFHNINESTHYHVEANYLEINKLAIIPKILKTIALILLYIGFVTLLVAVLPGVGKAVGGVFATIGIPIVFTILKLIWGF